MAYSSYNLANNAELRTILDEKMRRRMYWFSKFGSLIGANFLKAMNPDEEVPAFGPGQDSKFTGAPIEVVDGFIQQGRTDMLIPVDDRLTGLPVFGDKALQGSEEAEKYAFRSVFINRMRKAVAPPTGMEKQKIKQWKTWLINSCEPKLRQWFSDYFPSNLLSAIYFGYSRELLAAARYGGRALAAVSHPNLFVAGSGQVSYAGGRPGVAGYEASVEAALNGLTGAAGQGMSVAFLRNLVQEAARAKIAPIVSKEGHSLYPVFLKDAQFNQLRQDPEYVAFAESLKIAIMEQHPLAHLGVAVIDGALVIVDSKMWGARTHADDANVTAGTVEYGPAPTAAERLQGVLTGNTITQLDQNSKAGCILIGKSALTIATGEEISVKQDVQDYENVKGFGIDCIKSVVRNELYDILNLYGNGANAFMENTSSLVGFTWSPYALNY